jgi:hypothetical protein
MAKVCIKKMDNDPLASKDFGELVQQWAELPDMSQGLGILVNFFEEYPESVKRAVYLTTSKELLERLMGVQKYLEMVREFNNERADKLMSVE